MLEYIARITSQEPVTEDLRRGLSRAISDSYTSLQQAASLQLGLDTANDKIDGNNRYSIDLINNTQKQLCTLQVLGMSDRARNSEHWRALRLQANSYLRSAVLLWRLMRHWRTIRNLSTKMPIRHGLSRSDFPMFQSLTP